MNFSPGSADANVQVSAGLRRSCDQRRVTCSEYVCHSATSARFISTSLNFHCNVFGKGSRGSTFKMLCCLFWPSRRKTEAFSIIECALLLGWAESAHSEGQQAESCHQNDNTEIRPLPSCRQVFKGVSVLVLSLVNIYALRNKGPFTRRQVSLKTQQY